MKLKTHCPRRNTEEWDKLAKWIVKNELFSDNVRWLIQIPRLYDVFKKSGGVQDFEEVVRSEPPHLALSSDCNRSPLAAVAPVSQTFSSPCSKSRPILRLTPSSTSSSNASSGSTRSTTNQRLNVACTASSRSRRIGTQRRTRPTPTGCTTCSPTSRRSTTGVTSVVSVSPAHRRELLCDRRD